MPQGTRAAGPGRGFRQAGYADGAVRAFGTPCVAAEPGPIIQATLMATRSPLAGLLLLAAPLLFAAAGGGTAAPEAPRTTWMRAADSVEQQAPTLRTRTRRRVARPAALGGVPAGYYQNPVLAENCPDPAVIRAGGTYYLTCTSGNAPDAFPIRRSGDLVSWKPAG